jgi:uncharacterized protein (DUF1697 family)
MILDVNKKQYLALLRGINVGGKNIIKMAELKGCFENLGFSNVTTYIQSGNVIFSSTYHDEMRITTQIEEILSSVFGYESTVVLVSSEQLKNVVTNSPVDFGINPTDYKYDVLFIKQPIDTEEVMRSVKTKEGVDKIWQGDRVVYFSRLAQKAGSSYMSKIVTLPVYKLITIRNWNTTTKLYELMKMLA